MTVSIKHRADAALRGSVWAVGIAIAATGALSATTGMQGFHYSPPLSPQEFEDRFAPVPRAAVNAVA